MKKAWMVILMALPLVACAGDYYDGPYGPGPIAYDGYYDDYYGPIYDGYWGTGDIFYYRRQPSGRFLADRGEHFRRDADHDARGRFHPMHGDFTPPRRHGHEHHRD